MQKNKNSARNERPVVRPTKFFSAYLKAPLRNFRSSWGAVRPDSDHVFLKVWDDHIEKGTITKVLLIDGAWNQGSFQYKERQKHINLLRAGFNGFGVVCTALDAVAGTRTIATYDDRRLLTFGELKEQGERIFAEVTGSIEIGDVVNGRPGVHQMVTDIAAVLASAVDSTTKEVLAKARIGQGQFRTDVMARWGMRCCVTGCELNDVIRASHIKPWSEATELERLDPSNGLPLVATLDALFDSKLITFDDKGTMLVSQRVSKRERELLGLDGVALREPLTQSELKYLAYHREQFRSLDSGTT